MGVRVDLRELTAAIELQGQEDLSYLDRRTGQIVMLSDEDVSAAKRDDPVDEYPEWRQEQILLAREVLGSGTPHYLELPSQFDVHEWSIMERFCRSLEDREIADALAVAIRGRGAFRFFRAEIRRLGVEQEWYRYRDAAMRRIAIDWCEAHNIEFDDSD